ncbi:MAG TPA: glycine betaine ABC transporter substrate-binding protein [Tepidisphaeraceae bacterium]|nr:glycine betaine ABC transporter substrate-binding protein [Tepidisphaeraceae bacterium]
MRAPFGWLCIALCVCAALVSPCSAATVVRVGSKVFTESVILGELATQLGREAGVDTIHKSQLGGTRVLWEALLSGQIDAYPEYTGTIARELLPGTPQAEDALRAALAKRGIGMTESLGFNDTYALGMTESLANQLHISTIDDLRRHPNLRMGFSNEFVDREDCWPAVKAAYHLPQTNVTGLDHDLAYRAIASGSTDVIDLYSTDAEIAFYHLRVLDDDRRVFPEYQAVYLYRLDLNRRAPAFVKAINRVDGMIDVSSMIAMNDQTKLRKIPESQVASQFLLSHLQIRTDPRSMNVLGTLILRTREHLLLVGISLAASILLSVPLGVMAFAWPKLGQVILAVVSIIYTIPSLALLVFMIPLFGIGTWPAIVALFLYGLLPIVRNTHAGLLAIPPHLRESAVVLGLSPMARLLKIELPMAGPSILAGIKTAAVINVGTATIGALIGAGGYGQPILTGIRLADTRLILLGAIPAAILALLVQGGFGLLERAIVPRGLRLKARS